MTDLQQGPDDDREVELLKVQIEALQRQGIESRKQFITYAIDRLIEEEKVPANEREFEIKICMQDEKRLKLLNNRFNGRTDNLS